VILKELTERIKTRLTVRAVHIIPVDQDYESGGSRRKVCRTDCVADGATCVIDARRDELHKFEPLWLPPAINRGGKVTDYGR
jgi:hypothetical protein